MAHPVKFLGLFLWCPEFEPDCGFWADAAFRYAKLMNTRARPLSSKFNALGFLKGMKSNVDPPLIESTQTRLKNSPFGQLSGHS